MRQPEDVPNLARLASLVFHVDPTDPPLLPIHGYKDPQVLINQFHKLVGAYGQEGLGESVVLRVVHGGKHGGKGFFEKEKIEQVA